MNFTTLCGSLKAELSVILNVQPLCYGFVTLKPTVKIAFPWPKSNAACGHINRQPQIGFF